MKKLVNDIINRLFLRNVQFADVRFTSSDEESFYFERGDLKRYNIDEDKNALGIRVLVDGAWGFAGLNTFNKGSIDKAIKKAINNAKHTAKFKRKPVILQELDGVKTSFIQKPEKDPFLMMKKNKIDYFSQLAEKINNLDDKIIYNSVNINFSRQYKIYANTEGTFVDTLKYITGPKIQLTSSNGTEVMRRTYPGDMNAYSGGFEVIDNLNFDDNIDKIYEEVIKLLDAPRIKEDKADLIIGYNHLALQIHESIGHATEADRLFGKEISYAGKTFVKPEMIGKYKYGSDKVNIVCDTTDRDGIGYHPVDDEGVKNKKVDIIKNGILVGLQTSREAASKLGIKRSASMLANYADNFPLIRMTNINLLPGEAGTLKNLIKNTEKGYYINFTKSWSIDDSRNNFQFTTEIGWKIEDGEITGIVKEPTYYGITKDFWNSCDAICGEEEWEYNGTMMCGKGEPGQGKPLSHKTSPARFRNVDINVD